MPRAVFYQRAHQPGITKVYCELKATVLRSCLQQLLVLPTDEPLSTEQ